MARAGQPYHHGDLRGTLVRTALEMLERAGPEELSLRGLAEAAGVSRSAPYSHFRDKRALLAAIAEVGFDRFAEEMSRSETPAPDAETRFLDIGRGYVRFALRNPSLFKLMFSAELASLKDLGELRAKGERTQDIFRAGLDGFLRDCGAPTPAGPAMQTLAWSTIHGLSLLLLEQRLPPASAGHAGLVEEVTALFTEMVRSWARGAGAGAAGRAG